jgi:uncharacterized protein with FMN-binding domain
MQPTYERQSKTKLIATILTIVVVAGLVLVIDNLKSKNTSTAQVSTAPAATSTQSTETTPSDSSTSSSSSSSTFKDGTYTASSDYFVPHGNESIKVSLTLKDGVVTSSNVQNSEGDPDSARFQEDFASSYKSFVVGKKISDVRLGAIAGASDTAQGFNDALEQITSQAQA